MKFDPEKHLERCYEALSQGKSMRMLSKEIGVDRKALSKELKKMGIYVPSRNEAAANTWKNHQHPGIGVRGADSPQYGHKMSPETRAKMEPVWRKNGDERRFGVKEHRLGYLLQYAPDHPHAMRDGYVLQHRLVAEKAIGRYLSEDEVVHHKNGNKKDNRPKNLAVLDRAQHARLHAELREEINAEQNCAAGKID